MRSAELLVAAAAVTGGIFAVLTCYQLLYLLLPHIKKDPPHRSGRLHRYAVLICARNEAAVLPHLLASIRAQSYPAQLISVFVAADNCTDATAAAARAGGAAVYERFDTQHIGKGYALEFLLENIRRDHGDSFDGYFVFDADNLLQPDYIEQMNRTFCNGYEVITSLRNSKNYGDNWISAGYGLWFLRESEYLNHARFLLGTGCAVSGTGFLFSAGVLRRRGGWRFHLLTEDIEFSAANILAGERTGFCAAAEFFDEQPTAFSQSWRQRLRWARGYVQVFFRYGRQLLAGAFGAQQAGGFRHRFSCYDMTAVNLAVILCGALELLLLAAACICALCGGAPFFRAAAPLGAMLAGTYLYFLFWGGITTASQWRRIHTTRVRKLLYVFTFPLFMLTYLPIGAAALFCRVEWKPIRHTAAVPLEELQRR